MFKLSLRLAMASCALSLAANVHAADAFARLDGFVKSLTAFEAEFTQTLRDGQSRVVETSSGLLAIRRPNRFRWDYREPHAQVIVADGEKLWMYDPELEQATVRPLQQTLAGTPAILLSGAGDLRESFRIEKQETRGALDWITLTPKRSDADFKRVRLALRGDRLQAMELADKLGQTTYIEFVNLKLNPTFAADRFTFTPPAGVDVIGAANANASSAP